MLYISLAWYPDIQGTPTWMRRLAGELEDMVVEANSRIFGATMSMQYEALCRLGINPYQTPEENGTVPGPFDDFEF